jgi:hypothetical protein
MLGDNLIIEQVVDTLVNAPVKNLVSDNTDDWFSLRNLVDLFYKLATVLIALFNVGFAVYIYRTKDKKEDDNKEADRRIGLLKTLILDYNLKHVYSFFDDLETHLSVLRDPGANKVAVEQNIQVLFKELNEKFIYFLSAVDNNLYDKILGKSDNFRDKLVANIFDDGINIHVERQYNELIDKPYKDFKKNIIQDLFGYTGK